MTSTSSHDTATVVRVVNKLNRRSVSFVGNYTIDLAYMAKFSKSTVCNKVIGSTVF